MTTLPVHTQSGSWPAMNVDKYDVAFAANHVILAHLTGTGTSYVPMLTVLDAVTGTTVLEDHHAGRCVHVLQAGDDWEPCVRVLLGHSERYPRH